MTAYIVYYIVIFSLFFFLKWWPFKKNYWRIGALQLGGNWERANRTFVVIAVGMLICLLGLRNPTMGADLDNYFSFLKDAGQRPWGWFFKLRGIKPYRNVEVGYWYLMKVFSSLGIGNQGLVFICAVLPLGAIGALIYRESKNSLVSLIILLGTDPFLMMFSALRQVLAMGILVCALPFIKKGKFIPFSFMVIVASLFHFSAVLFLPAYFIYRVKLKRYTAYLTAAVLPLMWVFQKQIFTLAVRITGYTGYGNGAITSTGAGTLFGVYILVYFFCVLMGDRNDPIINGTSNLFWVACAIQSISGVSMLVGRIGIFYVIYLTVLLPNVLEKPRLKTAKQRHIVSIAVSLCFALYGIYSIRTASWPESYPYSFFWAT